jgi:hypothetical protein
MAARSHAANLNQVSAEAWVRGKPHRFAHGALANHHAISSNSATANPTPATTPKIKSVCL